MSTQSRHLKFQQLMIYSPNNRHKRNWFPRIRGHLRKGVIMNSRKITYPSIVLILSVILTQGCANTPPADCPTTLGGYKEGQATSVEVKQCLGKPAHENRNPDGRYIYMYNIQGNTIAFLFDSTGKLIRIKGYVKN